MTKSVGHIEFTDPALRPVLSGKHKPPLAHLVSHLAEYTQKDMKRLRLAESIVQMIEPLHWGHAMEGEKCPVCDAIKAWREERER